MKVGIISFFDYDVYIKPKRNLEIYENWNKVWEDVFKLSEKNNIHLFKYNSKKHEEYEKIIFVEIPRINELIKVMYLKLHNYNQSADKFDTYGNVIMKLKDTTMEPPILGNPPNPKTVFEFYLMR